MMKTKKLFDMNRVNDAAEAMRVEILSALDLAAPNGWRGKCASYNSLTNAEYWHALQRALTTLQSHTLGEFAGLEYDTDDDEPWPMTEAEIVNIKQAAR
jgi:hypothetical protein